MKSNVSIFVPTRKNSERVLNKNTRPFCGIEGGLLKIKLDQVLKVNNVDEIILSTNDEESIRVAKNYSDPRIKIIERPESLCLSDSKVSDLISYVPKIINNDVIFWIHVTSPFVNTEDYNNALDLFFENLEAGIADSLASVSKIQQFIWDNEKKSMINFDISGGEWPRTQDLKPLYEINHAYYINTRANYIEYNNRISANMAILELERIKQIDIDWEQDFLIAESIYEKLNLS